MATSHMFEYSKSSRAKCHGPPPCKGTPIELGTLRYGHVSSTDFGEVVEWRHWGCVSHAILSKLAATQLEHVPGFSNLRKEDRNKIRIAVGLRRVDPKDVPASAKPIAAALNTPGPSQAKRKAAFEASHTQSSQSNSQPKSSQSQPLRHLVRPPTAAEIEEDGVEEVVPEESIDELYVMLKENIVGVQYYKGLVGPDEEVRLVREPHNRYDRNAIKVENIGGIQVGHIPRGTAARLAPLMDQKLVTVEGVMHEGNLTGFKYSLSMTLKIYGAADKRNQLEPMLIWATPGQRGFPARAGNAPPAVPGAPTQPRSQARAPVPIPSASQAGPTRGKPTAPRLSAAQVAAQQEAARKQLEALEKARELRQILDSLEKVDDEGRRNSLLDTLCAVEDILALPEHPSPPSIASGDLKVNLLKHQSQALQWCIDHEYPKLPTVIDGPPVQFWQLRKAGARQFYFNVATKTPQEAAPVLGRGALCADSMGLGKTLTMLSLILATKSDIPQDYSSATLIVVPLSVLSNWEKQIEDHVTQGTLSYCTYYGSARNISAAELQKYDIVITTYQTVVKDGGIGGRATNGEPSSKKKKGENALFRVKWKRVILDEGHNIRNPKTQMAQAVCGLEAQRRWVLTGTPIINSPKDLGSILTFLRICRPLDNEDFYKRMVLRPLKDGHPSGAELIRALMNHICIRRTKEMQDKDGNYLVPLPPVDVTRVPVALTVEARELYDMVDDLAKERVGNLIERHGGIQSAVVQSNILSLLTRLRQLALHPGLVPSDYLDKLRISIENEDTISAAIDITPAERVRLQGLLAQAIEDNEECPICFGILDEPRITSCSHCFCLACISEVISRDPKCPMDRRAITMGDLIEPLPATELTQAPVRQEEEEDLTGIRAGSSAKIDQLVNLLKLTPGTEKSLVFSQFTAFLDKIAETLDKEGIPYVRFDGKMSAKRRQETIARFSIPIQEEGVAAPVEVSEIASLRPRRIRTTRSSTAAVDGDVMEIDNEQDGDFVMENGVDDDDDFIDDAEDEQPVKRKRKSKGKGKATSKPLASGSRTPAFSGPNPKVMLISLKAGALGLNLTVANNVYLMDPWWQEGIESQAIDRCNRIGQTKPVHVYQLIAENTVESKVIEIQEKKNKLIKHAFSGMKSKETQRQKKEARLQELVELFGVQHQQATAQNNSGNGSQATLDNWRDAP